MRIFRTTIVMGVLVGASLIGTSTPAQACTIQGGPLSGKNCWFAVLCTRDFAHDQTVDDYVNCLI